MSGRPLALTPAGVGFAAGVVDGIIDPSGTSVEIPYAHLGYCGAITALGFFGQTGRRPDGSRGRWDPNVSYALMTAGVTLAAARLPHALTQKSIRAAYGDEVIADALAVGGHPHRPHHAKLNPGGYRPPTPGSVVPLGIAPPATGPNGGQIQRATSVA